MRQLILAAVTACLVVGLGIYHGMATDRWTNVEGDENPGKCFANMPLVIGDWKGEALSRGEGDDPKNSVINTRFTNRLNGRWMLTAITSGRAGRVAIHDPEHCYLGSGYKVVDAVRQESFELASGRTARFWTGHFEKTKPSGIESIRIYWGWTLDGQWQAPDYPRLLFAGKAQLHKLYMIHPVSVEDEREDTSPYRDFMVKYLNELNRHLEP
jgi:hypothetical protein